MKRRIGLIVGAVTIALGASACSSQTHAEYASYSSFDEIAAASVDVVEVTVGKSHKETLYSEGFTGDDPETNPCLGVKESDRPSPEDLSVDVIVYDTSVEATYKGTTKSGDLVEVHQLPNEAGGVPLEEGKTYLLFLLSAKGYPSGILGGPQGQFLVTESGYEAAETITPLKITQSDLASISG